MREAEPSRMKIHMPLRRFSSASSSVGALVVGLDARGEVGVQLAAAQAGRVAVDALVAGGGDLGEHLRVAAHHARGSP